MLNIISNSSTGNAVKMIHVIYGVLVIHLRRPDARGVYICHGGWEGRGAKLSMCLMDGVSKIFNISPMKQGL